MRDKCRCGVALAISPHFHAGREGRAHLHASGGLFEDVCEQLAPEVEDEVVACVELDAVFV